MDSSSRRKRRVSEPASSSHTKFAREPQATDAYVELKSDHLASDIIEGNVREVEETMTKLLPSVLRRILCNRYSEYEMTHLLLLPYSEAKSFPTSTFVALVSASADPQATDSDGNSLLHLLVRRDREADLVSLMDCIDDPKCSWIRPLLNKTNDEGRTPLQVAVMRGQLNSTDGLLRAGADVNFKSLKTKLTALHYAVLEVDCEAIVERLLDCEDIDINAETIGHQTPLDMAIVQERSAKVKQMIIRRGGRRGTEPPEDRHWDDDSDDETCAWTATMEKRRHLGS